MQFWKLVANDTRGMLLHQIPRTLLARHYASEGLGCTVKGKNAKECTPVKHPKARSAKNIEKTFPFYHLIKFKEECCGNPCIDAEFPRFDDCLYEESDKNKRKYQVTWVECPPMKIKPKKICCFEKVQRPPIVRRKPQEKPPTACQVEPVCRAETNVKCPRVRMPGCRPVRSSVWCHRVRHPTLCHKIKAPYPSFSECARPRLRGKRRTECECLEVIPMCGILQYLNRMQRSGRTLNPCARK